MFKQHYSSWPAQPCSSLSATLFKLASSTMFNLSTGKNKLCIFTCVVGQNIIFKEIKTKRDKTRVFCHCFEFENGLLSLLAVHHY